MYIYKYIYIYIYISNANYYNILYIMRARVIKMN